MTDYEIYCTPAVSLMGAGSASGRLLAGILITLVCLALMREHPTPYQMKQQRELKRE